MPMKKSTKLAAPVKSAAPDTVRSFRIIDFLFIVFFLAIAGISINMFRTDLMHTIRLKNTEPVGTVTIKKNIVQRRLETRVLWDRLATESPVYLGDLIRVAEFSEAILHIKGNNIELSENTLIRITLAPDGETLQIILSEGGISVTPSANSTTAGRQRIVLYHNEQQIQPIVENGFERTVFPSGRKTVFASETAPKLKSPAEKSVYSFNGAPPALNFQWDKIDEAYSYILEISNTADFINPAVQIQSQITYYSASNLEEGEWFWRVKPLFASEYIEEASFSTANNFRIEKSDTAVTKEKLSFAEWLAVEMPQNLVSIVEPAPVPVSAAVSSRPAPPARLPAPRNLQPARGHRFTMSDLQAQRRLNFSWQAVNGANAYILTIFQQANTGRRQIFQTQPLSRTNYSFEDLHLLDRGNFVWQVEAVNITRSGTITQRGNITEGTFIMDILLPGTVQVEGTGVIDGQ